MHNHASSITPSTTYYYSPSTSIVFHLPITAKTRRTSTKPLQIEIPVLKNCYMHKQIRFIDNSGIKVFH